MFTFFKYGEWYVGTIIYLLLDRSLRKKIYYEDVYETKRRLLKENVKYENYT